MKVYLISSGEYSDYTIDCVYLDLQKAEEYVKWHKGTMIEAYDTADDQLIIPCYVIVIELEFSATSISNKVPRIQASITSFDDPSKFSGRDVFVGRMTDQTYLYRLCIREYVPANTFNPNTYKDKYTKVAYDTVAHIQALCAEGYNIRQINQMFSYAKETSDNDD